MAGSGVDGRDLELTDGRTVRMYDTGGGILDAPTLIWHHGSPQTGALLEPVVVAAAARGIRVLSYGRPSYGGSSPQLGRDVASAAADVAQIAAAAGVTGFAVIGASGGGPHALACAALLPDHVWGAVCLASPAPYAEDFDWFAGMADDGGLRAAMDGREARATFEETAEFDENSFIAADYAVLADSWSSLGADSGAAGRDGPEGLIDDDVAFASPWGFDGEQMSVPVLLVQGGRDRVIPPAHAAALQRRVRGAELWLRPDDGHVSVLEALPVAMDWLLDVHRRRQIGPPGTRPPSPPRRSAAEEVLTELTVGSSRFVLRSATAEDVPALVTLLANDQLSASRDGVTGDSDLEPYLRAFSTIDADPSHLLLVAVDGDDLVATMQLSFLPGLSRRGALRAQVEAVRVAAHRRSDGLGTALMTWAVEEAQRRGCALMQLTTDKRRTDAHRFYTRFGFTASHEGFKLRITS